MNFVPSGYSLENGSPLPPPLPFSNGKALVTRLTERKNSDISLIRHWHISHNTPCSSPPQGVLCMGDVQMAIKNTFTHIFPLPWLQVNEMPEL